MLVTVSGGQQCWSLSVSGGQQCWSLSVSSGQQCWSLSVSGGQQSAWMVSCQCGQKVTFCCEVVMMVGQVVEGLCLMLVKVCESVVVSCH